MTTKRGELVVFGGGNRPDEYDLHLKYVEREGDSLRNSIEEVKGRIEALILKGLSIKDAIFQVTSTLEDKEFASSQKESSEKNYAKIKMIEALEKYMLDLLVPDDGGIMTSRRREKRRKRLSRVLQEDGSLDIALEDIFHEAKIARLEKKDFDEQKILANALFSYDDLVMQTIDDDGLFLNNEECLVLGPALEILLKKDMDSILEEVIVDQSLKSAEKLRIV